MSGSSNPSSYDSAARLQVAPRIFVKPAAQRASIEQVAALPDAFQYLDHVLATQRDNVGDDPRGVERGQSTEKPRSNVSVVATREPTGYDGLPAGRQ